MKKALLLMLLAAPVHAGDWSLIVDAWSYHAEDFFSPADLGIPEDLTEEFPEDWNEHNPSLGVEYTVEDDGWATKLTVANYTDSHFRDTWYGGAGWMYPLYVENGWRVDGGAYLLYFRHEGYRRTISRHTATDNIEMSYTMPDDRYFAPMPGLSVSYKHVGANLTVIPPVNGVGQWTSAIQLKLVF